MRRWPVDQTFGELDLVERGGCFLLELHLLGRHCVLGLQGRRCALLLIAMRDRRFAALHGIMLRRAWVLLHLTLALGLLPVGGARPRKHGRTRLFGNRLVFENLTVFLRLIHLRLLRVIMGFVPCECRQLVEQGAQLTLGHFLTEERAHHF